MKKLLNLLIIISFLLTFTSCKKGFERWKKSVQVTDRSYHIELYSGGSLIQTFEFKGILNDSEGSDGYYFYKGDTLIEISGDIIIKSTK